MLSNRNSRVSLVGAPVQSAPENIDMDEGASKLSVIWTILKKLGTSDVSSVRMSLPANLMEPRSNLEFWNYNDRPDYFISLSDSLDPAERMLHVLRWFLCKDTKWKAQHPQLRKPYQPVLGEFLQCEWSVPNESAPTFHQSTSSGANSAKTPRASIEGTDVDAASLAATLVTPETEQVTISCISEQLVHSPSVSAFYYECKERGGISARGVDHVTAKFTGTAVKIGPGEFNHGVYVNLNKWGEEYNCSFPWASVAGWISGNPYITVSDVTTVVCEKSKLKCILLYKDEPFFGAPKFAVEGKIFRYDPELDRTKPVKDLKKIDDADVVATIWGQWNGKIYAKLNGQQEGLLLDLQASETAVMRTPPIDEQAENESRRIWEHVSNAIHAKDFAQATKLKRDTEDEYRKIRAQKGSAHKSKYFDFKVPLLSSDHSDTSTLMERGKPYLKDGITLGLARK
ncbi:hypothetical protein CcCBS67573_g07667 [Chytriomyces confervae]|uniref:Oxysterol-binding protein n=1 Tax=Chytriomyces confervae TaxID=246404 RepID=A0A507EU91_9FUNG|nr:hypothetical protein HDU80_010211 [Chytriomyces hyalinus]TPX66910.1 hypothetical protein CcCBS67573_g07667 [Chytriomyces confervae]